MEFTLTNINTIIVGKWNRYLLTPSWLSKNIFKTPNIKVEVPVLDYDAPPRFSDESIQIILNKDRLEFHCIKNDDDTYKQNEEMIKIISSMLQYTPVFKFGINYHYNVENPDEGILELFNLNDTSDLYSSINSTIKSFDLFIKRKFYTENKIITFEMNNINNSIALSFNFEYTIKEINELNEIVTDSIKSNLELAKKILLYYTSLKG